MDLIDIFRTFHPNAEEYTFFSSAHGAFSRIVHTLGHKWNLSKSKKSEKNIKHLLQPQRYETRYQLQEKKKLLEANDNENMTTQNLWDAAKAVLRGKFIAIQSYPKKQDH